MICTLSRVKHKTKAVVKFLRITANLVVSLVVPCFCFARQSCSSHFEVISKRFGRGLRFVLLVGLYTKRRPSSNSLINANLVVFRFCFGRQSSSNHFEMISRHVKTILKGSSFCTFGRVMYKTKTLVKFVDKRKSCCFSFLLWSTITFEPF